jgi:hypothetical protein
VSDYYYRGDNGEVLAMITERRRESIQRLPSAPGSQQVGELVVRFRAYWKNDPASRAATRAAILDAQQEMLCKIGGNTETDDAPWHVIRRRDTPEARGTVLVDLWVFWAERATAQRNLLATAVKYLIDEIDEDALKGMAGSRAPQMFRENRR